MKKSLLILLLAAVFALLLVAAGTAAEEGRRITPEEFEQIVKDPSTSWKVDTSGTKVEHPEPDFSDPNLVFRIPARVATVSDPDTGAVISEQVIPMENTVAAVHEDVALLREKDAGWIVSWPANGPIPLTSGSYSLSGSGDLSAGKKVLIVETDGTMHAFYSGGVENNLLAVADDSLEVYTCIAAVRSREPNKTFNIDTTISLPKKMGTVRLHGTLTIDYDIDAGWIPWYGAYISLDSMSAKLDLDLVEVQIEKMIEPVNKEITHVEIPIIDGLVGVDVSPRFFLDITLEGDVGFTFASNASFHGEVDVSYFGTFSFSNFGGDLETPEIGFLGATVGAEVYTGLEWGPGVDVLGGVAELGVQAKAGPVLEGELMIGHFFPDDPDVNRYHACESLKCLEGNLRARIGPAGVMFWTGDDAKEIFRIMDPYDTDPFLEFYHSWDYGDGSFSHLCPHIGYKLLVSVVDQDNNPLKDAVVGFTPYESQFKDVAENVKYDDKKGYWLLYVPKSNPTVDDKDSNTVTVTASIADPLDPSSTLTASKDITEKGMSGDTPDPKSLVLQIDLSTCTLSFKDTETGDAGNMPDPIPFHPSKGKLKIPDNVPEKAGRIFTGWNTKADGTGTEYHPGQTETFKEDTVLYAQWRLAGDSWYVAYNPNGGTKAPEPQVIPQGEGALLTTELPENGKMIFRGWARDARAAVPEYQPGDFLPYNSRTDYVVLYALWDLSPVPEPICVSFDANGVRDCVLPADAWFEQGTWMELAPAEPPVGSVYNFLGWSEDPASADPEFRAGQSYYFYKNTALYAVWDNLETLTLTFRDSLPDEASGIPNPIVIRPSMSRYVRIPDQIPQKDGRAFTGWNSSSDGTGARYAPGSVITLWEKETTLWAQWHIAEDSWFVVYNANGGSEAPGPQVFTDGQDGVLTRELPGGGKMIFSGWALDPDGSGTRYMPGDTLPFTSGDDYVVLYAVWDLSPVPEPIRISFADGGLSGAVLPADISCEQGTWITLDAAQPPVGSTAVFMGWSEDPGASVPTAVAGHSYYFVKDTVLFAVWDKKETVTLTFLDSLPGASSGIPDPISIVPPMSPAVDIPAAIPQRTGAVFTGWNTKKDGSGTRYTPGATILLSKNTALWAQWETTPPERPVVVSFNANGGQSATVPAAVSQRSMVWFQLPEGEPSWDRQHAFLGWSADREAKRLDYKAGSWAIFSEDTVLYAVWNPQYTVISGAGDIWDKNSTRSLRFVADGNMAYFTEIRIDGKRFMDGVTVHAGSISGTTAADIKPWALQKLDLGFHEITFKYEDGEATAPFKVTKLPPKTGDSGNPALWIALAAAGLAGLGSLLLLRRHAKG